MKALRAAFVGIVVVLVAVAVFFGVSGTSGQIVVAGKDFDEQTIIGEMAAQLIEEKLGLTVERKFNLDAGIDASQDTLPKRLLSEPIPEGPSRGAVNRLEEMLPGYYAERGWDENGVPTPEKLEALGLA